MYPRFYISYHVSFILIFYYPIFHNKDLQLREKLQNQTVKSCSHLAISVFLHDELFVDRFAFLFCQRFLHLVFLEDVQEIILQRYYFLFKQIFCQVRHRNNSSKSNKHGQGTKRKQLTLNVVIKRVFNERGKTNFILPSRHSQQEPQNVTHNRAVSIGVFDIDNATQLWEQYHKHEVTAQMKQHVNGTN